MNGDCDVVTTTKGMMRVLDLQRRDLWRVDDDQAIHRVEFYLDGELVKADSHVFVRKGEAVIPQQANLGG